MSTTTAGHHARLQKSCCCRVKQYAYRKKKKDRCKRKRQVFVYNPEEEIWHEPYMQTLRREFSDESVLCDSKIELPWRDIALPAAGRKIRSEDASVPIDDIIKDKKVIEKESVGTLPWQDLLITETLPRTVHRDRPEICDSSLEIPWDEIALDKPMVILPPKKMICEPDDIEIPWDEILVPANIVIEPEKKRKHPSSAQPPRARVAEETCTPCRGHPCCIKTRNIKASDFLTTAM